jgi:RNA-directed DNA polymerase
VASNRGAPGPDRQSIEEVREHLDEVLAALTRSLLEGTFRPGDVRRVWIPKAGGGQRGLGIPNVVDRVVQEAVRLVLEPLYEPTFHASSHGSRRAGCEQHLSGSVRGAPRERGAYSIRGRTRVVRRAGAGLQNHHADST